MIVLKELTGHPQVSLGVVNPVEHVRPALKCDALQCFIIIITIIITIIIITIITIIIITIIIITIIIIIITLDPETEKRKLLIISIANGFIISIL